MPTYTAQTVHTEKTVTRLAKAQYLAFSAGVRFAVMSLCCLLLMLALFGGFSRGITILLLALGCLPLAALNQPARQMAESALRQLAGSYPTNDFVFTAEGMKVQNGQRSETVAYREIVRLVSEDEYAYLFLRNHAGYMVALATLHPADRDAFRRDVARWAGLEWTKNRGVLGVSLKSLRLSRKNTRK
ncbi:MAG: YcxB family protein [Clostridiales bacterium]|nr:YcxB family protein [Clostridiales bacterium]